jgi:hypothetical protein
MHADKMTIHVFLIRALEATNPALVNGAHWPTVSPSPLLAGLAVQGEAANTTRPNVPKTL